MKRKTLYIFTVLVLLVVCCALQLRIPQRFSWKETYAAANRHPYGCFVFDSVMRTAMPHGYEVTRKTFYQLSVEKDPMNVLVVADRLDMDTLTVASVKRLLQRGATIMLAFNSTTDGDTASNVWSDTFGVNIYQYDWFTVDKQKRRLADSVPDGYVYDSPFTPILWKGRDGIYPPADYRVYGMLVGTGMDIDETVRKSDVLVCGVDYEYSSVPGKPLYEEEPCGGVADIGDSIWFGQVDDYYCKAAVPLVVRRRYGRGQIIFCSTPRLLTNYGVLDGSTSPYVHRLMTLLADRRTVRIDAVYDNSADKQEAQQSPFRYVLSQPPLRSALYTLFAGLVLCMALAIRRRQRAIPVRRATRNYSLDFVRLVGSLYYRRHDASDLVTKRYYSFAEEMRRLLGVDITDVSTTAAVSETIAQRTGVTSDEVQRLLRRLRIIAAGSNDVTEKEMKKLVDKIDQLVQEASI